MNLLQPYSVSSRTKAILRAAAECTEFNPDLYVIGSAAVAAYAPSEIEPDDLDLALLGKGKPTMLVGVLPKTWTTTMDTTISSGVTYSSPEYSFNIDLVVNKNIRANMNVLTTTMNVDLGGEIVKVRVLKARSLRREYEDLIDDALPGSKIEAARKKIRLLSRSKEDRYDEPDRESRFGRPPVMGGLFS